MKRYRMMLLVGDNRSSISIKDIAFTILASSGTDRLQKVMCIYESGLPITSDGCAPTITAVYEALGPANIISVAHYPKMAVGVICEAE